MSWQHLFNECDLTVIFSPFCLQCLCHNTLFSPITFLYSNIIWRCNSIRKSVKKQERLTISLYLHKLSLHARHVNKEGRARSSLWDPRRTSRISHANPHYRDQQNPNKNSFWVKKKDSETDVWEKWAEEGWAINKGHTEEITEGFHRHAPNWKPCLFKHSCASIPHSTGFTKVPNKAESCPHIKVSCLPELWSLPLHIITRHFHSLPGLGEFPLVKGLG